MKLPDRTFPFVRLPKARRMQKGSTLRHRGPRLVVISLFAVIGASLGARRRWALRPAREAPITANKLMTT